MQTNHTLSIAKPHGTQQLRPSFGAKIISKCTPDWAQNPPQNASKSFNSGSTRVQTVGVLPRMIFHRFWGPVLELEMLPKSIPKSRHFQVSPRNSFYAMGAPKTLQNDLQNALQNQPFSQEVQNLKILLSARQGASFRGLDPFKLTSFFEPFLQPLSNPSWRRTFPDFSPKW